MVRTIWLPYITTYDIFLIVGALQGKSPAQAALFANEMMMVRDPDDRDYTSQEIELDVPPNTTQVTPSDVQLVPGS